MICHIFFDKVAQIDCTVVVHGGLTIEKVTISCSVQEISKLHSITMNIGHVVFVEM